MDDALYERASLAMKRLRRRHLAMGPHVEPIRLPELEDLELPMRVPGDKPAQRPPDDRRLSAMFWRPDGTMIGALEESLPRYTRVVAGEVEQLYRAAHQRLIGFTTRYRNGVRLIISTVFLPIDHGWGQGDPVLWESMVFHGHRRGKGFGDGQEQWRYASREAARAGHRAIVHAITEANRARRAR